MLGVRKTDDRGTAAPAGRAAPARAEPASRGTGPKLLDRKYPNAPTDWRWQRVFPQENRWTNTKTGQEGRHHVHVSTTMVYTHVLNKGGHGVRSPAAGV